MWEEGNNCALLAGKIPKRRVSLEDARRSGRPKLLNSKAKKVIRDHLTRNTRATIASAAASVQKVVQVSARTVQREIYERAKSPLLYGQVPTAPISRANALLRKAATTAAMRRATKRKLRKLVFLDAANVWFKKGKDRVSRWSVVTTARAR